MSSVVRPSGPLPPRVYWTRRLLLLAIVVVLVWGVARCAGGSNAADKAATTSKTSPSAGAARTVQHHQRPQHARRHASRHHRVHTHHRVGPAVALVRPNLPAASGTCDPTQVSVSPSVVGPAYAGRRSLITLVFTTTGKPCTLAVDAKDLLVAVQGSSGTAWTSHRCTAAIPSSSLVLRPGWLATVGVAWTGHVSDASCSTAAPAVATGSYTVQAAVIGGEPASTTVHVQSAPTRPTTSPSASPTASQPTSSPTASAPTSSPTP
ncbi:MAG: hypothetical protein ACRDP1_03960 [Nocardioidaceae bacterium]